AARAIEASISFCRAMRASHQAACSLIASWSVQGSTGATGSVSSVYLSLSMALSLVSAVCRLLSLASLSLAVACSFAASAGQGSPGARGICHSSQGGAFPPPLAGEGRPEGPG